ncbi:hypothetical protein EJB05_39776, partial [Eragrostis curvula]
MLFSSTPQPHRAKLDMGKAYVPVFILLFLCSTSQSEDQLTQAKPLSPGDELISEGGDFALGFFSTTNSNTSLYIGIWYHNLPERERTVVWVANRDSPITTPSAQLAISNSSELVLSDRKSPALWTSSAANATAGGAGAVAVLKSSGNFVLRSSNGTTIWQSFDHPTDTVLPTVRAMLRYKAQTATRFFAWKGPDDPSTGDISGGVDPDSNLQFFIWNGTVPYCRATVFNDASLSSSTYKSNATSIFYQAMVNTGDEFYYTFSVSAGSPYTRLSLDYTGKLSLLSWNSKASAWAVIYEHPGARCDLYASCGPFGHCDSTATVPACRCLDGFVPVDAGNFSRGCQRMEALTCEKRTHFVTMPGMKVPDKFLHIRNRSFDQCAAECSAKCSCTAYAYANISYAGTTIDTSRCLVWTGDLVDTGKDGFLENLYLRLADSSGTCSSIVWLHGRVLECSKISLGIMSKKPQTICKSKEYQLSEDFTADYAITMCAATRICSPCLDMQKQSITESPFMFPIVGTRQKKKAHKRMMLEYLRTTDEAGDKNIEFTFISFEDIVAATDNFSDSNMLGKGGFGKVYKGMLERSKEVAIKRLSKGSGQGTEEFRNEVVLIAKLQHKNLVKILGCCIHEDEKLLVYEYLPNKSLDQFLFDSGTKSMLQWPTRFKIVQGIARGIMYLHHDSRLTIIHRDLKASNILLDKEMSPKISDFGMARIFCGDQLEAKTNRVVGTYGYMSPEYAMGGAFSVKSDTYSFGVLLLEIAWNLWMDGKTKDLVDSSVKENCPLDEVSRCVHIGLFPDCRPLMSAVVFMLENKTKSLPLPMQPVYFARRDAEPGQASDNRVFSVNNMSLTTLEGR